MQDDCHLFLVGKPQCFQFIHQVWMRYRACYELTIDQEVDQAINSGHMDNNIRYLTTTMKLEYP